MKTQILDSSSAVLEVSNEETGLHYSASDCPGLIRQKINQAMAHQRYTGIVFDSGLKWEWAAVAPGIETVKLEFVRNDAVEFEIEISLHAWRSFSRLAQKRGVDAREWLVDLLGYGLARDLQIGEMVRWIFGGRSPSVEIQAFEAASQRFHGGATA